MSLTYGFALGTSTTSQDFSHAFQALAGDGVTQFGGRFGLSVNGFSITVSSGRALAAGRWLENSEPLDMSVQISDNNEDRTDALAVRADDTQRKTALEILTGVNPDAIRADLSLIRNDETYSVLLYFIKVRRGSTALTLEDVTDLRDDGDLCGAIVPLSDISGDAIRVYNYLLSGIDDEVDALILQSKQIEEKADTAIAELDSKIQRAGGTEIGELLTSRNPPAPTDEWLLCDGGTVPAEYTTLYEMLGGTLPQIAGDRYQTYIYGGAPS